MAVYDENFGYINGYGGTRSCNIQLMIRLNLAKRFAF